MELPNQSDEPVRTAKLVYDFPQPTMTDGVKGLGQVYKGGVEADILFLTLLMQLPCSEYHTYSSLTLMEVILTL